MSQLGPVVKHVGGSGGAALNEKGAGFKACTGSGARSWCTKDTISGGPLKYESLLPRKNVWTGT